MKTLIITVGTRQVGWRSEDDVIRCLGVDQHINALYQELGLERGTHSDEPSEEGLHQPTFPWAVWDLGERFFNYCQEGNFSSVELLLDQCIIEDFISRGLNHVILWGTQQPKSTSWQYRRFDTLWLAKLMAGKLQETYSQQLQIKVFSPKIVATKTDTIRKVLENEILPFALQTRDPQDEEFTLLVENKGATPAISEGLNICAAALVRDCNVTIVSPKEPKPQRTSSGIPLASPAQEYDSINLSSYFWPLERSRITAAWERGDFREAEVWLSTHKAHHKALYELAQNLALAPNWQIKETFRGLRSWIVQRAVRRRMRPETHSQWYQQIEQINRAIDPSTPSRSILKIWEIWESTFLVWLELKRQHFSLAFLYFSQTLERILFLRYQSENWIEQGYITPPENKRSWGVKYPASFGELRHAWQIMHGLDSNAPMMKQFKNINDLRNSAVHKAIPLTLGELRNLFPELAAPAVETEPVYMAMEELLQSVCSPDWGIPEKPVSRSLYDWGLEVLRSEAAQVQN